MKRWYFILFITLIVSGPLWAQQKKALEHSDFAIWNQIPRKLISNDGNYVSYVVQPGEGNPTLHLYNAKTGEKSDMERAAKPQFSEDSRFLIFTIHPDHDAVKRMKKQGKSKKDLPKDTLAIYALSTGELKKVPNASSVTLPNKWNGWLAFKQEVEIQKDSTRKETRTDLIVHDLENQKNYVLEAVESFKAAEDAAFILGQSNGYKEDRSAGIFLFDGTQKEWTTIHEGEGEYQQLSIDPTGQQVAFLADFDTLATRLEPFDLYYWNKQGQASEKVLDRNDSALPQDWLISKNGSLSFSENGKRLFFGIAPAPALKDTSLLPEEEVSVEVWSYNDPVLYTQQEVQANREKRRTYQCVLFTDSKKMMQIGSKEMADVRFADEGNGSYALAYNQLPYLKNVSWEGGPSAKDVYLINMATGKKEQIKKAMRGTPSFSPEGKFIYWYSSPDTAWFAYNIEKKKEVRLTPNNTVSFADELNDRPMYPSPYGIAGWTKDDDFLLLYDRYDVWLVDPSQELANNNLTSGRKDKVRSRYIWLDRDERAIEEVEPMLMHFTNEETLEQGYYWFNIHTGTKKKVQEGPFAFTSRPIKAKKANNWVFTKEDYQTFPDLQFSKNGLGNPVKISDANPQQSEYNWGSIELYEWTSTDGQKLRGLLVKPEGFDPDLEYPMIVNFYERSSQGLRNYRTPTPHRSTINYPFYASRGYLIFNPDVPYTIGYPGESAYNSVLSGVSSLIDEGFVDKDNIGLQGHSWGGYQIAHIITKTDMFKCAESGAPVVNMISAYGGIRWGSGMSRMFQYEHTQSRIGGTLWEKPLRYIENSPIFFADKINTPVLILHNDNDGAVPWYQGIEFFVAMRRLGKPAWMLNYNDEPHWPLKLQNRKDFQLRMSQFFDYYLKGAAMPRWMAEGVPAIEKGVDQRLELMDKH